MKNQDYNREIVLNVCYERISEIRNVTFIFQNINQLKNQSIINPAYNNQISAKIASNNFV